MFSVQPINAFDDASFGRIDFQTGIAIIGFHRLVSETSAPGVKSSQSQPLHASVCFLAEFAPIYGVDQAVHAYQQFSL